MTGQDSIGVAVIGAGMAGRAHAAGYRSAGTVFGPGRPELRLVAVADTNTALAEDAARRYGYQRTESCWQAIAEADDIDAVSVVVANNLHREIIEGLLAAGKHVLCEKPLAGSRADAEAMVAAAERAGRVAVAGYTYRWAPAVAAIRREVETGTLGEPLHFNGRYWCDYGLNPQAPMAWRYRGGPGSGALADLGSHLLDMAEFVCGPLVEVSGAVFSTAITERPVPAGPVTGHELAQLTGRTEAVENEDLAMFTARFASGAAATFSISRVAHGLPNGLGVEVFCRTGSAAFDLHHLAEFTISDNSAPERVNGHRRVITGPEHPYLAEGVPMIGSGQAHGLADLFTYQARAFLDQIAGVGELPPCASFADGLHDMRVLDAVTASAAAGGAHVKID